MTDEGQGLRRDDVALGIACVMVSVMIFASANLVVKWLGAVYPVPEMLFLRNIAATFAAGGLALKAGGLRTLRTRRPLGHIRRGFAGFASIWASFEALQLISLAEATALSFSSPLFIAVLSAPVLRERVGLSRWMVVVVGFAGVLAIAQPGRAPATDFGSALALLSGFLYALAILQMRELTRTEHPAAIACFYAALSVVLSAALLPFTGFVVPSPRDAAILLGTGGLGGVAQTLIAKAYSHAPASVVAPFIYGSIVWAALFGWAFFGEWPNWLAWSGIALVVGSGLFLGWRETRPRPAPATQPKPG